MEARLLRAHPEHFVVFLQEEFLVFHLTGDLYFLTMHFLIRRTKALGASLEGFCLGLLW